MVEASAADGPGHDPPEVVEVRIGRVEIRAAPQAQPAARPGRSLDAFLRGVRDASGTGQLR